MKKIITTVVALTVMGSVSFAQDAAKTAPKKKAAAKTEATSAKSDGKMTAKKSDSKMDAAGNKMDAKKGDSKMKGDKKAPAGKMKGTAPKTN